MPLIDPAPFRDMVRQNLDDRAYIIRQEWVDDGEGSGTFEPDIRETNVPCYIKATSAREAERYGQQVEEIEATIQFEHTVEVRADDVIRITTRDDEEYEVIGVPPKTEASKASTKAFCRRRDSDSA